MQVGRIACGTAYRAGNGVYIGPGALLRAGGLLRQPSPPCPAGPWRRMSPWSRCTATRRSRRCTVPDWRRSCTCSPPGSEPKRRRCGCPYAADWWPTASAAAAASYPWAAAPRHGRLCRVHAAAGVALAHLPTTLLAQTDSAIGGKTGLDLPEGKTCWARSARPRWWSATPPVLPRCRPASSPPAWRRSSNTGASPTLRCWTRRSGAFPPTTARRWHRWRPDAAAARPCWRNKTPRPRRAASAELRPHPSATPTRRWAALRHTPTARPWPPE